MPSQSLNRKGIVYQEGVVFMAKYKPLDKKKNIW